MPIFYRKKRLRTPLSHYIKQFLRWLDLRNEFDEEIIREETNIQEIFDYWTRALFIWFFRIFLVGTLIYIAVLPFYSVSLKLAPFIIFSFGLAHFIILELIKEIRSIIKKGSNG